MPVKPLEIYNSPPNSAQNWGEIMRLISERGFNPLNFFSNILVMPNVPVSEKSLIFHHYLFPSYTSYLDYIRETKESDNNNEDRCFEFYYDLIRFAAFHRMIVGETWGLPHENKDPRDKWARSSYLEDRFNKNFRQMVEQQLKNFSNLTERLQYLKDAEFQLELMKDYFLAESFPFIENEGQEYCTEVALHISVPILVRDCISPILEELGEGEETSAESEQKIS
jgi:hypothetical protein